MITQRPNPTALASSVRMNAETLADIECAKNTLRASLRELTDYAAAIGVSTLSRLHAAKCAEDILSDLFFEVERDARERIEADEHQLARMGG
jgi:hypothetical protein